MDSASTGPLRMGSPEPPGLFELLMAFPWPLLGLFWASPGACQPRLGFSWASRGLLLDLSLTSPGSLLGLAWATVKSEARSGTLHCARPRGVHTAALTHRSSLCTYAPSDARANLHKVLGKALGKALSKHLTRHRLQ